MRIETATFEGTAVIAKLNETIHQLHCELSPDYCHSAPADAVTADLAKLLQERDTHAFIAWDGDVPIGYCILQFIEQEPNSWARGFRRLLVDQLSVEPGYRRQGIGTRLIQAAFDFASQQGVHEVTLNYWVNNVAAREFYKTLGFVPLTEKVMLKLSNAWSSQVL